MWNNQICEEQATVKLTGIYDTRVLWNRHSLYCRSWRKWFWRICIKYTKQNVTLHNAAGFLPYQHDTEKIWNCCCHPQISAWCPFLPLKFIFNSTWLCTELLDSVLCPRVRRRWWWDATWVPFPWISFQVRTSQSVNLTCGWEWRRIVSGQRLIGLHAVEKKNPPNPELKDASS